MSKIYRMLPYVIHEHLADRAGKHWDLRIKYPNKNLVASWALPKYSFPKEIGEKKLAVKVHDHGRYFLYIDNLNIPEGEYGAGVIKIIQKGLAKIWGWSENRITFSISGEIATGTFSLIRFASKEGKIDSWVLIRVNDKDE